MIFAYPTKPCVRKHGPAGYAAYETYKPWLRDEFVFRCAYCLVRERWYPNGPASFSVDHFVPQIIASHRVLDYENLIYACVGCNSAKRDRTVLDPCQEIMSKHLQVNEDGTIEALTPEGAEHIEVLRLDDPQLTGFRGRMLRTLKRLQSLPEVEGKHRVELQEWFGFPDDLPNLAALRPPGGNTRPDGVSHSFHQQKRTGTLPVIY